MLGRQSAVAQAENACRARPRDEQARFLICASRRSARRCRAPTCQPSGHSPTQSNYIKKSIDNLLVTPRVEERPFSVRRQPIALVYHVTCRFGFQASCHPEFLFGMRSLCKEKVSMKTMPEAPHQITQSQQVRRISARRERISAVSAWAQWGASPLQPSKTTRKFGRANERRTGLREVGGAKEIRTVSQQVELRGPGWRESAECADRRNILLFKALNVANGASPSPGIATAVRMNLGKSSDRH